MNIRTRDGALGRDASPTDDTDATLYRFELIAGTLVRGRPGDARPCADADRYLIDVLLDEDRTGRYLNGVHGFVVPRRGNERSDPVQDLRCRRTFKVGVDLMLAIGSRLSVGPHPRPAPKLATLDGRRVG